MKYVFANHKMNFDVAEVDGYMTELLKTAEFKSSIYDREPKLKPGEKKAYKKYLEQVEKRDKKHVKPLFDDVVDAVIFPSALHLRQVGQTILKANKRLGVGAQNCYFLDAGEVSGEISARQLSGVVDYVLVGHSERRQIFNETDEMINLKTKAVIDNGMTAVLCVGETRQQYERGETKSVIAEQLKHGLDGIDVKRTNQDWLIQRLIVAYEPVWAIGSGTVPAIKEIARVLKFISGKVAAPVLYGGSVNPDNAAELMKIPENCGFLVGGASLDVHKFATIVEIARNGGSK
ncbi:MAG: triose-phosphate isomerase [Candidatus Nomurabacteria bacterium]|jgi:triosephosphate isomerase|nr:triose-phosphate isomerase [Candidatus Nomurabacteria bacterium]